jgi:phosphoribosylformylglycinamidine synthase
MLSRLSAQDLHAQCIGSPNERDEIRLVRGATPRFAQKRIDLQRAWSETTWRMQALRDNPECAQQEYERILDASDPGLHAQLSFDPGEDVAVPYAARGARPRIAILREQGVNGHVEMAAAFDRAGFDAIDVHMSDIIAGRVSLSGYKGSLPAAASPTATCSARARAGPVHPVTRARATSSRPLPPQRRIRLACATAAR